MRICFVCGEYPPQPHGGIGTMVQTLGRALVAAGHEVRVVGLCGERRSSSGEDAGVRVWRLSEPRGPGGWIAGRHQLFRQVAEWARGREIDIVEVPDWQGWAAHWPALSVPVVTRLHGSATYFAAEMGVCTDRITAHLERSSIRRSDFWCSVSRYTARRTQALFQLRSPPAAILPNAVERREPTPWEERDSRKVVFAGTLTMKKGVIPLIDAWTGVVHRFPDAMLSLLGKDGVSPTGRSMIEFLQRRLTGKAAQRVRFCGHAPREQVLAELRTARAAVFPSFAEAFALAPLEAMSAGCPTVGSALGSGAELIVNEVDGLTVDPSQPRQIEDAVTRLLADEGLARRLAAHGREKIERQFSLPIMTAANLEFFRECVLRGPQRRDRSVRRQRSAASLA